MPIGAALFALRVWTNLDMYVQAKGQRNDASFCREQQQVGTRLQQSLSADWGMTEEAAPRPSNPLPSGPEKSGRTRLKLVATHG